MPNAKQQYSAYVDHIGALFDLVERESNAIHARGYASPSPSMSLPTRRGRPSSASPSSTRSAMGSSVRRAEAPTPTKCFLMGGYGGGEDAVNILNAVGNMTANIITSVAGAASIVLPPVTDGLGNIAVNIFGPNKNAPPAQGQWVWVSPGKWEWVPAGQHPPPPPPTPPPPPPPDRQQPPPPAQGKWVWVSPGKWEWVPAGQRPPPPPPPSGSHGSANATASATANGGKASAQADAYGGNASATANAYPYPTRSPEPTRSRPPGSTRRAIRSSPMAMATSLNPCSAIQRHF